MRHRKHKRRLGRKTANRKATLQRLATALLVKESIRTTKAKAKVTQSFIETLITAAKDNTLQSKRYAFSLIRDKGLINLLFNEIAPRFKARNGGYTRVIPIYPRRGDGAPMAILEFVEKRPKVAPKKVKKKEPKPKEEPKKAVAPAPKADVKEEVREERAREEQKKIKKAGFFKSLRRYFRGKAT